MRRLDAEVVSYLAQMYEGLLKTEKNPFRLAVVEAGQRIRSFKARMLGEIISRLRREVGTPPPAERRRQAMRIAASAR